MLELAHLRARSVAYAAEVMGHKRYGTWPDGTPRSYFYHLALVETILLSVGLSPLNWEDAPILAAAWNHDTIEDTGETYNDVRARTNDDVADIVVGVTNDVRGKTRAARHTSVVPSLLADPRARILKLADRAANVTASLSSGSSMAKKYRQEYPGFRNDLYESGTPQRNERYRKIEAALWAILDDLNSGTL